MALCRALARLGSAPGGLPGILDPFSLVWKMRIDEAHLVGKAPASVPSSMRRCGSDLQGGVGIHHHIITVHNYCAPTVCRALRVLALNPQAPSGGTLCYNPILQLSKERHQEVDTRTQTRIKASAQEASVKASFHFCPTPSSLQRTLAHTPRPSHTFHLLPDSDRGCHSRHRLGHTVANAFYLD